MEEEFVPNYSDDEGEEYIEEEDIMEAVGPALGIEPEEEEGEGEEGEGEEGEEGEGEEEEGDGGEDGKGDDDETSMAYESSDINVGAMNEILRQEQGEESDLKSYTSGAAVLYKTAPYLTQYERARVLGLRSQQLSAGAEPMVPKSVFPNNTYPTDDFQIALKELQMRRMPFVIGRKLPNGAEIKIPVSSLMLLE